MCRVTNSSFIAISIVFLSYAGACACKKTKHKSTTFPMCKKVFQDTVDRLQSTEKTRTMLKNIAQAKMAEQMADKRSPIVEARAPAEEESEKHLENEYAKKVYTSRKTEAEMESAAYRPYQAPLPLPRDAIPAEVPSTNQNLQSKNENAKNVYTVPKTWKKSESSAGRPYQVPPPPKADAISSEVPSTKQNMQSEIRKDFLRTFRGVTAKVVFDNKVKLAKQQITGSPDGGNAVKLRSIEATPDGITNANRQLILDLHNTHRAKVARGELGDGRRRTAANMIALDWDDRLEIKAAVAAHTCHEGHDPDAARAVEPYLHVGQNWAGNSQASDLYQWAVWAWFDEHKHYSWSADYAGVGHYTQEIWANTRLLGCGMQYCQSATGKIHLVCNYAPAGNVNDVHVYKVGEPCSQCPTGYSRCMAGGLCATVGQCAASASQCVCVVRRSVCEAHGSYREAACECECEPGYTGHNCEVPCEDGARNCQYNRGKCEWNDEAVLWLLQKCARTCNWCDGVPDYFARNANLITTNAPAENEY